MRRIAWERRKLIGIGIRAGLVVLPARWFLRQAAKGAGVGWRTDTAPLERAFGGDRQTRLEILHLSTAPAGSTVREGAGHRA